MYIIVSYGQPEYRLNYLEKPEYEWTVKVQQIPKPTITSSVSIASEDKESPNVHYIYICRKGAAWLFAFHIKINIQDIYSLSNNRVSNIKIGG